VEEETVQVDVPVSREKVRLVTEPVTEANRDDALSGPDLTESEHEVTLTEERPVVSKETVPVERVRLETQQETDVRQVEETVGKERIDVDGDVDERTAGPDRR
jgi:stress response protein YsnF